MRKFSNPPSEKFSDSLGAWIWNYESAWEDPANLDGEWKDPHPSRPDLYGPFWVIPGKNLSPDLEVNRSNNNVSIKVFGKKLFLAFRTGPTHFASRKTGVQILSTIDGRFWTKEFSFFPGRDVREPFFAQIGDSLLFFCFAAGKSMTSFEPQMISRWASSGDGTWVGPVEVLEKGEVHWSMKNRNGSTFLSSYSGSHYELKGESHVSLNFQKTEDGLQFKPVGDSACVYFGGVSECDFEFDADGNLWAVTRLEDGDRSGFGSHVVFAPKDNLGKWEFPETADPNCYMSPKVFRQGNEIFLVARLQKGKRAFGHASRDLPMKKQRIRNWVRYSLSPKGTALYRINQDQKKVEWVMDLPGTGDTAFPSIIRLDKNHVLIANYSSPFKFSRRTWLEGQLGRTGIYFIVLSF